MSIDIRNLSYEYLPDTENKVLALDNVSLTIESGKITALVGHTGSGKSTLIQTFNALQLPSMGEVVIDDKYVVTPNKKKNKNLKDLRKHLCVVFQFPEYQLFEETVEKDVAFGLKNYGVKEEEAIKEAHKALEMVGLDESFYKRSPFELSGGEKRRVALAGILILKPEILVLDEPTAGLDPAGTELILSLIKQLNSEGKTIVLVSHDMDIVLRICDEVIVLKKGKIMYQGAPYQLFSLKEEDLAIEVPALYRFAQRLIDRGINIKLENIKDVNSLINEVKEAKKWLK